jgi:hypothetical protein
MDSDFFQNIIQNACPSIKMRVKQEMRNNKFTDSEKNEYEKFALQGKTINTVLSWQMSDGYFGTRLHTPPSNSKIWSHEGCVRYLLEMGFSIEFHPLKKALDIMLLDGCWEKEFIGSKAGQVLGFCIIRASLFSQARLHDYDFVHDYIKNALDSFNITANARGFSDMAIPYKGKHIYVNGKCLPTVYDFRILAFTNSWRTEDNLNLLSKAYKNLYEWLPFPPTYIKAGSQLIAPFGSIQLPLNSDFSEAIGFPWFDFYELSARMGVLSKRSPFYKHFNKLFDEVKETKGEIFSEINKKEFIRFSSYSGLALEDDWIKKQNKINDLTFRCYLINYFINSTN